MLNKINKFKIYQHILTCSGVLWYCRSLCFLMGSPVVLWLPSLASEHTLSPLCGFDCNKWQMQSVCPNITFTGLVFTKGLRLKSSLKVKTFVSAKFCIKTVFTKGDLAKSKIIK